MVGLLTHRHIQFAALAALVVFVWYEFIYTTPTTVATVPNDPANSNALGVPTAPVNASTLSPLQLGSGLFENESGLQTSPGGSYG